MNAVAEKENPTIQPQAAAEPYVTPHVNVIETKDGYVLEAEMPGVAKDGLSIDLEGNVLTLVGRRPAQTPNENLVYRESRQAAYRRAFALDSEIDTARITARIEQGLLTVQLPKVEQVKPRKITVQ